MARYLDTIDLPLPIQQVFDDLADFSNVAAWDPGVSEAERLDDGPIRLGSRFRVVASFLGRAVPLTYAIIGFEPPHRLVLRGEDSSFVSHDEITLAPRGAGTRVTYDARLELSGLRRLADPVVHAVFQWVGRQAAGGLRERGWALAGRAAQTSPPPPPAAVAR